MSAGESPSPPAFEMIRDYARGRADVLAAWAFGSRAHGGGTSFSDLDLAFLLEPTSGGDLFDRRLEIRADLAQRLGTNALDVVVLNDAPVTLRFTATRRGRLLFCRDEVARVRFETDAMSRHFDMEPFRRTLARGLERRLSEGTFGR